MFKAGRGGEGTSDPYPVWVNETRKFYRQFPDILASKFRSIADPHSAEGHAEFVPKLWKTVGDEIIFCCKLMDVTHLAWCVTSFLRSLDAYGRILEPINALDVKGTGWVAAFPAPNVTVEVAGRTRGAASLDYIDEEFETQADNSPGDFDFLGKDIDSGFRVAQYAAADRFAVSAELGLLLCEATKLRMFQDKLVFHGREPLKGVISSRPYPIISVDTERSTKRRDVKDHERALTGQAASNPTLLRTFLTAFLEDEKMDAPVLPHAGDGIDASRVPSSYKEFANSWAETVKETTMRSSREKQASEADQIDGVLPPRLLTVLGQLRDRQRREEIRRGSLSIVPSASDTPN
ncbi:hypothetical protein [Lichenifustis flavocetrariae]|uniref:Uncharacterized protein n=1 Tax=Lichenifustis flavocetrariae TaxID=2949735 RepID=A0AA42CM51_9HYPH|nr:hypothetical protein [Lichenifustis flavocetrariae]MCW6508000.1 hypothetical protein [Lichenifustis flavocetrariae]